MPTADFKAKTFKCRLLDKIVWTKTVPPSKDTRSSPGWETKERHRSGRTWLSLPFHACSNKCSFELFGLGGRGLVSVDLRALRSVWQINVQGLTRQRETASQQASQCPRHDGETWFHPEWLHRQYLSCRRCDLQYRTIRSSPTTTCRLSGQSQIRTAHGLIFDCTSMTWSFFFFVFSCFNTSMIYFSLLRHGGNSLGFRVFRLWGGCSGCPFSHTGLDYQEGSLSSKVQAFKLYCDGMT